MKKFYSFDNDFVKVIGNHMTNMYKEILFHSDNQFWNLYVWNLSNDRKFIWSKKKTKIS